MVPTVTYLTSESIAAERAALLARTRLTYSELRARGEKYQLAPDEQAILRTLEDLDFLEADA